MAALSLLVPATAEYKERLLQLARQMRAVLGESVTPDEAQCPRAGGVFRKRSLTPATNSVADFRRKFL